MYLLYRKDEYYKPFYRNLRSISERNGMLYDYHEYTKLQATSVDEEVKVLLVFTKSIKISLREEWLPVAYSYLLPALLNFFARRSPPAYLSPQQVQQYLF